MDLGVARDSKGTLTLQDRFQGLPTICRRNWPKLKHGAMPALTFTRWGCVCMKRCRPTRTAAPAYRAQAIPAYLERAEKKEQRSLTRRWSKHPRALRAAGADDTSGVQQREQNAQRVATRCETLSVSSGRNLSSRSRPLLQLLFQLLQASSIQKSKKDCWAHPFPVIAPPGHPARMVRGRRPGSRQKTPVIRRVGKPPACFC
jgi:hypothetical protein